MDTDLINIQPNEWINVRERFNPPVQQSNEPSIDKEVSAIVGRQILTTDPRLIKLVLKWKQDKGNEEIIENYLDDPVKVQELKNTFI